MVIKSVSSGGAKYHPAHEDLAGVPHVTDYSVKKLSAKTGDVLAEFYGHTQSVVSLALSPDGSTLYSGSNDKTVKSWNVETQVNCTHNGAVIWLPIRDIHIRFLIMIIFLQECIRTFVGHESRVTSVAVSGDGGKMFSGGLAYDETSRPMRRPEVATLHCRCCDPSTHCKNFDVTLPQHMRSRVASGVVKVWNTSTGSCVATWSDHERQVGALCVSPAGVFSASRRDDTIRLVDTVGNERVFDCVDCLAICASSDGKKFYAVGNPDAEKKLPPNHNLEYYLSLKPLTTADHITAFSTDGKYVQWEAPPRRYNGKRTFDYDPTLRHLPRKDRYPEVKQMFDNTISELAISPDGTYLFSGGSDQTVHVWETKTGRLVTTLEGHTASIAAICVSPDGQSLFSVAMDGDRRLLIPRGPNYDIFHDPTRNNKMGPRILSTIRFWK